MDIFSDVPQEGFGVLCGVSGAGRFFKVWYMDFFLDITDKYSGTLHPGTLHPGTLHPGCGTGRL
jgi:hypothetical protein